MTRETGLKAQAASVKTVSEEEGTFEAVVAVFGNVDSYGDVILKGAFLDTLKEWEDSGYPIPVMWSHDKDDPYSHLGTVVEAKETDAGLWVKAQIDMEHNPKAAQVYRLLKGGRVKEFSFAFSYDPQDVNPVKRDGMEIRELSKLKVYEVGPTLVGANPATQLLSVKSAPEAKNSAEPTLFELATQLSDLAGKVLDRIEQKESEPDDEGEGDTASRGQAGADETHDQGKSADGTADRSADEQKAMAAEFAAFISERTDDDKA